MIVYLYGIGTLQIFIMLKDHMPGPIGMHYIFRVSCEEVSQYAYLSNNCGEESALMCIWTNSVIMIKYLVKIRFGVMFA